MLRKSTIEAQSTLSTYCRNGAETQLEGAKLDRLPHYRRLVYNVVVNALNTAYPITQKYVTNGWEDLQYRFFASHYCQHPQIWRMPEELIGYVSENEPELMAEYPALIDLLRFEWQEVYLFMMPDIDLPSHSGLSPAFEDEVVLEPEMQLLILNYPVHKTHPTKLTGIEPGQFASLAWRERETGKVRFMDISIFYALFLEVISSGETTVKQAGAKAALHMGLANEENWMKNLEAFVDKLYSKDLIFKK
ncbi:MAG: putative DNA-binding domain-containing protein [Flavobacteriia bacterium]|nr:putative DNA-binding domain-containing protein [Flavobacteriia bacterium]